MPSNMLRLFFSVALSTILYFEASAQFQYVSPMPGSRMHYPQTNIILRNGDLINAASLADPDFFFVSGSLSGTHQMNAALSDDGKTILLRPLVPFSEGEAVNVTVNDGIRNISGKVIKGTSFTFYTIEPRSPELQQRLNDARRHVYEKEFGTAQPGENTTRTLDDWKGGIL